MFISALFLFLSSASFADVQDFTNIPELAPSTYSVRPEEVFTPMSYDDQHPAQLVVYGKLPTICHIAGKTTARVDNELKRIYVKQLVHYYPGSWCAYSDEPYKTDLDLGILTAGQYEIYVEGNEIETQLVNTLPISMGRVSAESKNFYASVSEVKVKRDETEKTSADTNYHDYKIVLKGRLSSGCMHFSHVETKVYPNHIIEVLPVSEVDHISGCPDRIVEFNIEETIKDVAPGKYLIHVRTLNGKPYNLILDL